MVDFSNLISYEVRTDGFLNSLKLGKTYEIGVSAGNIAGESIVVSDFVIVGDIPSAPLNLKIV